MTDFQISDRVVWEQFDNHPRRDILGTVTDVQGAKIAVLWDAEPPARAVQSVPFDPRLINGTLRVTLRRGDPEREALKRVRQLAHRLIVSVDWEGRPAMLDRAYGRLILDALEGA